MEIKKIAKTDIEDIISLSPLQEGILFHYLQAPQSRIYCEQLSLEISVEIGEIDPILFEKAWNIVVKTNEMLRAIFRWEKVEKPSQIILKKHPCRVIFHDLSCIENERSQTVLQELKEQDQNEGFDLQRVAFRVTLCKLGEEQYEIIISNHHILYDGWSNGNILKEFFQVYHELIKGNLSFKLQGKPSFKEFIKWLQKQDRKKTEQYWSYYLAGFENPTYLPIKRKKRETAGAGDYSIILGKDIQNKLDIFIKNNRVTLATVFYAAWGILLQRYCSSEDVIFGTTVSGRSNGIKGIEDMVGLFINTIPLRINSYAGETIVNVISQIDHVLPEREEYEHTPLVDIQNYSSLGSSQSLFDTILVIENYPLDNHLAPEGGRLSIHSYSMMETTHYDLTVGIRPFKGIEIKFSFKQELFEHDAIENMAGHFKTIIQKIIEQPETVLSQLEIISNEEKNRIVYESNNTAVEYPHDKTIHQIFAEQVLKSSDIIALVGAAPRVCPSASDRPVQLTYNQLNEQSNRLASLLIEKGALPDNIIGIMMERSVEMIISIMGILKAGGAYLPIDPGYPQDRIDYMLKDSRAKLLAVANDQECEKVRRWEGELLAVANGLEDKKVRSWEDAKGCPRRGLSNFGFRISDLTSLNLAYIIYTSGTTGGPKGVMVEHRNAINTVTWYARQYGVSGGTRVLQISDYTFDPSVEQIFGTLLHGASLFIVTKETRSDIHLLRRFIDVHQVQIINFVPMLLKELLGVGPVLKSLRAVMSGGDKLEETVKDLILEKGYELYNHYGPTEITVDALTAKCTSGPVVLGKPIANVNCYILGNAQELMPMGVAGELYIGGCGVTRGYLNNPGLTADRFNQDLWDKKDDLDRSGALWANFHHSSFIIHHSKLYRTGDRVRWLSDGNIEFLGRIDHQVKIRGFRVELGEIEDCLLKNKTVKEAVVIAGQYENGEKYLCAYIVPCSPNTVDIPHWREYLSAVLPAYMVPTHFVVLEKIPLTAVGKIARKSLPRPEITALQKYFAPRDDIEKKLVDIWSEILGIDEKKIGIDTNFFELGGHSLKAMTLVLRIRKIFNANIPISKIFQLTTIRKLAEAISRKTKDIYKPIEYAEKKEYYTLSAAQKRLYILQQMEELRTSYNMFHAVVLDGDILKNKFEDIFGKLIQRHDILRTSFHLIRKEPVQIIHDYVDFEMELLGSSSTYLHGSKKEQNQIIMNFIRPFDLSKAPLLRAGLLTETSKRHILVLDMHHIAMDGISVGIFINEFVQLYAGSELPPVKLQYQDFSEWQSKYMGSGGIKSQEDYWRKQFAEKIPCLNLPFDYERMTGQYFDFDRVIFKADRELTGKIKKFILGTEITIYIILLTIYSILLSKYSGQEDIVIGTGTVGRTHPDTEQIIGMFINMLALRICPMGNKTCGYFLEEVKDLVLAAFENQDYPFDELVKKLNIKREYGRNPLFDTEFTFQEGGAPTIEIPGLKVKPYEYENSLLKFDLSLTAFESDGEIHLILGFSPRLFKRETIEHMAGHFIEIIEQLEGNQNMKLNEIKITNRLSEASKLFSQSDYTGFEF